jgi:hypothetical protein
MDEKQLQFLFNEYAKNKGFKDFGEFKSLMSDEGSRKVFFDDSNKELGFKDYNDFNETLGLKKNEPPLSVSSNTQLPLPSRVPKETSPYLKGLDFKSVTDAIKADKQPKKQDSLLGGLYNEAVGGLSSLASGIAYAGALGGASSMGSVGGSMPISNEERLKGASAIGNATRELVEKARSESSSKENEQKLGETDWTKGLTLGNLGGLAFGTPRLAVDLAAGALTGGGSFFAQGMGSALEELDKNKDAEKLTPNQKLGYIATSGIVNGLLMKVGFDKILKSTGLTDVVSKKIASEVTEDLIKKGIKATTKDIEDATMQKVSTFLSKAKRVGIKTASSTATGSAIGAIQQGSNDAIKILTNKATGKDVFDEQEIKDNFGKNMLNATVSGGAIGAVMGLGHSALENTSKAIRNEISKAQFPQDVEAVKQKINENYESGNITPEEANAANIKVQQYAEIAAKIPSEVSSEKKYAIIGGIEQRENIKKTIEQTQKDLSEIDDAFPEYKQGKQDQIDLLNAKLEQTNDYINDIVTGKKTKYVKDGDKYYKVDANGEEIKITKEHYDLANAIKEEDKVQKEVAKEEPIVTEAEIKTPQVEEQAIEVQQPEKITVNPTETVSEVVGEPKEGEIKAETPKIETKQEIKPKEEIIEDNIKEAQAKYDAAKAKFEKIKKKIEATQAQQGGIFGGEQKGMFGMNGEEAKKTLDPLRIAAKEAKAELEDLQKRFEVQKTSQEPELFVEEPNIKEEVKVETPKTVEQLRAEEQAEYAAMTDPNDKVKKKEIYDKYDKLITPLLEKQKQEAKQHKENIHNKFRIEFENKGIPKEQVDGAIALMEARAKSWASEEKGRNEDDWYEKISDVKNGEFESNDVKYQNKKVSYFHSNTTGISGQFRLRNSSGFFGVYFSPSKKYSRTFGDQTYKTDLYPQKTLKIEKMSDFKDKYGNIFNITKEGYDKLIEDGYDSVEWYRDGKLMEFIALNTDIIGDRKLQFQGNKGALETLKNGKLVIHALNSPDFSTMAHEICHVFESDLTDVEKKIVKDFGGSEPFARGFEKYLRDGKAPNKELQILFDKFKEWLTNIYQTLKGSPISKKITPEIKQIFDRLLTEKESTKETKQPTAEGLMRADAKKVHAKVASMEAPVNDAKQIALRYIADGFEKKGSGGFGKDAIEEIAGHVKRARLNTGEKEKLSQEVEDRDYYNPNEKRTLDQIAHDLWERSDQEVSEIDIKDALMEAAREHNTRLDAGKAYLERYNEDYAEEQHFARIAEERAEEFDKELKDIEDWLKDEGEKTHPIEAEEEHINNLIKQYEAEFKAENEQPTPTSEGEVIETPSSRTGGEEAKKQETIADQYEAIKDIKSKKAQEKAKEKLINDNFESIVSQLMLKNKIKRIC